MPFSPPVINLLVLRSEDIHHAVEFYQRLGLAFVLHSHGSGPEHYASEMADFVFEIYPRKRTEDCTSRTRIGLKVDDVDLVVSELEAAGVSVLNKPSDSEWGRRAVVKDYDGHTVELTSNSSNT